MNKTFRELYMNEIERMMRESREIEDLEHKGIKGKVREIGIGKILERFLPTNLKVGNGNIQDWNGNQSNETDLIVYNKDILPPVLFDENLGIYPIESVVYAIEVKSTSKRREVETTIEKFNNLSKLDSKYEDSIHTAYFAYKSDLSGKSELARYAELDNIYEPKIQVICVAGEGYYFCNSYIYNGNTNFRFVKNDKETIVSGTRMVVWYGKRKNDYSGIIDFIAGILNTTRSYAIGNYLLEDGKYNIYYAAVLDENNNLIHEHANFNEEAKENIIQVLQ